ncbi:hypothetical protein GCM10011519_22050 [Marmoricola endophyticus]|uniref:DUF429 domain-containing protein n=1 Tax=Marmoricola endophyticus TaxID=2040280 RepID=A0A917F3U2_9ACTN|nr:hypothetical protein GCM10011519_22050 [Marmoricola endophyticus]
MALVDEDGALVRSGVVRSDAELDAWLAGLAPAVIGIDAPIVVPNASGMREAERQVGRTWGRFGASAYPSHRGFAHFDPPRAEVLCARQGWAPDPGLTGSPAAPVALEVYPHPAIVALLDLDRVLAYKAKKGRSVADRQAAFRVLLDGLTRVAPLRLGEHPRWAEIRTAVADARRQVDLERVEDEVDGIVCAHLAWRWHHDRDWLTVYGDASAGYVVVPARTP